MGDPAAIWQLCATEPAAVSHPDELRGLAVDWVPARVPGTAAGALREAGCWTVADPRDFDGQDWWWRAEVSLPDATGSWLLDVGGIATVADVWVDGSHRLHTENMFVHHRVALGELTAGTHEVAIRCAALSPLLAEKRPRPRWKTRLVRQQNLRWFRTSLLGRMPGWSPTGAPVGPWRGCRVRQAEDLVASTIRAHCEGDDGVVDIAVDLGHTRALAAESMSMAVGDQRVEATIDGTRLAATVRVPKAQRWWPHTHGEPALHDVTLTVGDRRHELGRVGFRTIEVDADDDGFGLRVNGVPVFCRGASWMPIDPVRLCDDPVAVNAALDDVRAANMNMLRLSGTTVYEDDAFYDRCDELGILVWQDVMLANMDPPDDPAFVNAIEQEVSQLLDRLGHRPCLAVLCGGSEVEQQAAMLGLARERWNMPLFDEVIPRVRDRAAPDLVYVPSTPTGAALPFHSDTGVAHYYGVGAYLRPLTDARRAQVRFASECLAFANLPDAYSAQDAADRVGVPHDNGADWDFADVRDHYLRELFGAEPGSLLEHDPERYLALSRAVSGELIEATIGEWRRKESSCKGALVWFLRDLAPGAGWGIVGYDGRVKAAWWYARRAMAPLALIAHDEGLNGLHLQVVNDAAEAIEGRVRVDLYRDGRLHMESAETDIAVTAHSTAVVNADAMFDGFRDLTWAYRFGELNYDVIAATLLDSGDRPVGRAFHLPLGLAREREDLALSARAQRVEDERWILITQTDRFAQSVAIDVDGFRPEDNWFHLAPGDTRVLELERTDPVSATPRGSVRALNATSTCVIEVVE